MKDLILKGKILTILENIESYFMTLGYGRIYEIRHLSINRKRKIDKFEDIKNICLSKHTIKKVKTQVTNRERIFVKYIITQEFYIEYSKKALKSIRKRKRIFTGQKI